MVEFKDECGRNCKYYWYERRGLRKKCKGRDAARKYAGAESKGTFHLNQTTYCATILYKLLVATLVKKLPTLYITLLFITVSKPAQLILRQLNPAHDTQTISAHFRCYTLSLPFRFSD
jgi:hypothetical protein